MAQERTGISLLRIALQQRRHGVDVVLGAGAVQLVDLCLEFTGVFVGMQDIIVGGIGQLLNRTVGHGDGRIRHLHILHALESHIGIAQSHGNRGHRGVGLLAQGLGFRIGKVLHRIGVIGKQRIGEDCFPFFHGKAENLRGSEGGDLGFLGIHGAQLSVQLGEYRVSRVKA